MQTPLSGVKHLFEFRSWLKRIHKFKGEQFLKPYIERNADFQKEAEKESNKIRMKNTKFENNAIFGKLIEGQIDKFDVKPITTIKQYLKWLLRPTFKKENTFVMEQ